MTDDLPEMPWPRDGDILFKSDEDWWHNACLNWFPNRLDAYATGYQEAAKVLVEWVLSNQRHQDLLVYPIVFLYRQHIELRLKEIITVGSKLIGKSRGQPTGHDINRLWGDARGIIAQVWPESPTTDLDNVESYLSQFAEVDPASTAFRYASDREGKVSVPGIRHINIRNFAGIMERLGNFLEGVSAAFGDMWDSTPKEHE